MMKILICYADGFEDVEAIATRDVLVRAGISVYDAKIDDSKDLVVSSHKVALEGFKSLKNININDFEGIIIPGGSKGVTNLLASEEVISLVKQFNNAHKLVAAICAGPMVLDQAGILNNKQFTCYPGCEEGLSGQYLRMEVVEDDNIITARSMLYSIPFGLTIIEKLLGRDQRIFIYEQIAGLGNKKKIK